MVDWRDRLRNVVECFLLFSVIKYFPSTKSYKCHFLKANTCFLRGKYIALIDKKKNKKKTGVLFYLPCFFLHRFFYDVKLVHENR